jgi:L-alanine-DL-glutamate epimerase-like enolase superfamily enzyme
MEIVVRKEFWPYKIPFTTSQWSINTCEVIYVEIRDGDYVGHGECMPCLHSGDSVEDTLSRIEKFSSLKLSEVTNSQLAALLPPSPARSALDCALWDLRAKKMKRRASELLGVKPLNFVESAYTISLDLPSRMELLARENAHLPLLKIKLGHSALDLERIKAIRAAAPNVKLIVDANCGWTFENLIAFTPILLDLGVELIEQPMVPSDDQKLDNWNGAIDLCADESCQGLESFNGLSPAYRFVNVKLEKAGGLTEALRLTKAAFSANRKIFIGSMGGTSLAMAPSMMLTEFATYVDLDGPMLLTNDRLPSIWGGASRMYLPQPALWG